jgi:hypothetical protein
VEQPLKMAASRNRRTVALLRYMSGLGHVQVRGGMAT